MNVQVRTGLNWLLSSLENRFPRRKNRYFWALIFFQKIPHIFLQHLYYWSGEADQGTDEFAEYLSDKTADSSHIEQTKEQNQLLPVRIENLVGKNDSGFEWCNLQLILCRTRNSTFNFTVVICRIRIFPTLISKIKWFESELPLNFVKLVLTGSNWTWDNLEFALFAE